MHVGQVIIIISLIVACFSHNISNKFGVKHLSFNICVYEIRVITKLPNSEQSYKGKVKTHNYINRQNQSTTGKL